jgi:hypothetical protein
MVSTKMSFNFFLALALTTATASRLAAETSTAADDHGVERQLKHDRDLASSKTFIVTFVDDSISPSKRCEALAESTGGTVDHVYDHVLNGCSLTLPVTQQVQVQAAFTALSNNPSVMNVEFDQMVYAYQPPSISENSIFESAATVIAPSQKFQTNAVAAMSWGLDRIDQCALPLNNQMTKQDATGVTVFILDSGIRGDHVEFAGMISTDDCHFSAINGETALVDGYGHG